MVWVSALQYKKKNRERVRQIPFGKKLADDGQSLVIDPDEMRVISTAKRLRNQGHAYQNIAVMLEERGCRNKSGKVKWSVPQIYRMLKN